MLPLVLSGVRYPEMEKRLHPITKRLGIEELLEKYPYEVSGGQKQRTAVARALISLLGYIPYYYIKECGKNIY